MRWWWLWLVVASAGCDPLGRPCTDDDDCGPGFDCYHNTCEAVCTDEEECRPGYTCVRFRCQPKDKKSRPTVASKRGAPPVPDATGAELRAIRRELELIRREQRRLSDLIEARLPPPKKATPPAQVNDSVNRKDKKN